MPKPTLRIGFGYRNQPKPLRGERVRHSSCDKATIWRVGLRSRGGKLTLNKGTDHGKTAIYTIGLHK